MGFKLNGTTFNEWDTIRFNSEKVKEIKINNNSVWKCVPDNMEDASWDLLSRLLKAGKFPYKRGDKKSFVLNGKTYHAMIANVNTGTGDAAEYYPANTVDFITDELYPVKTKFFTNPTYGDLPPKNYGFPNSTARTFLQETIYPLIPADLKEHIIYKKHKYGCANWQVYSEWSQSGSTTWWIPYPAGIECQDYLWLPTCYEMQGKNSQNPYVDNFENASNNIYYRRTNNKEGLDWWYATMWLDNYGEKKQYYTQYLTYASKTQGTQYGTYSSTTEQYVPICFRIG